MSKYECAYCGGFHEAGYIDRPAERCPIQQRDALWSHIAALEHRVTALESGAPRKSKETEEKP